jgi:ATP-dependent DNA helicase RecG
LKIWNNANLKKDWSAQIAEGAYLEHLDDDAIEKAKKEFKTKHKQSNFYLEIDGWNDLTFLNKAKLAINGKLTFAAIILLGKQESTHFINPAVARISWILKDKNGIELDYFHFDPPFLLNVDKLFNKIRNLTIRELPDGTLFPIEIDQYDNWVMREALHNCIAHQDYRMQNRITILENPDDLVFVNSGSFLPGSIENVLEQNAPHSIYPNKQLTEAMVNLNMIDIIGSGIRRMFISQRNRFMPLPGYDLSIENKVRVKLIGKVLDGEYTKALIKNTELTLAETILLDKVQKRHKISQEAHQLLKKKKLVEGRYPNIFVSSEVAQKTDRKVEYQKYKAFNTGYYKDMILAFIKRNHSASPEELNQLILGKLPDNLSVTQKKNRLRNIMYDMSHRDQTIKNNGKRGNHTKWYIKLD